MSGIPPRQYLAKIDEFLAHYPLVNAALAPGVLTLPGGYLLANLTADRAALAAQMNTVEQSNNNAQAASADRDIRRAALRERMRQFNNIVRGLLPGSIYAAMLPKIPGPNAAPGAWQKALDDMAHVWSRINTDAPPPSGFTPPLLLVAGYTLAQFNTDRAALAAAFTLVTSTRLNAEATRRQRDALWKPINSRLVQYRAAVTGRFPAGHPLILSLPILSPRPGSTPDPVNVSAVWDAAAGKARITHTASSDPRLADYQLRGVPGASRYDTETEQVLATNPPGLLVFETNTGLVAPGSVLWVKVYVRTENGNEKGSKAVKITRP